MGARRGDVQSRPSRLMARPPQQIGTFGKIKTTRIGPKKYRAYTRFRLGDGSYAQVVRFRQTAGAAEAAIKDRCRLLANEIHSGEITPDSRVAHIAERYREDLDQNSRLNEIAPGTAQRYGYQLKNWIIPKVGQLTARELQYAVRTCERLFEHVREERGYATAKSVRAVLSGMCHFAIRHHAMTINPVRSAKKTTGDSGKEKLTLNADQREDLFEKLRAYAVQQQTDAKGRSLGRRAQVWTDIPEMLEAMLATGGRLGEILALDGSDIAASQVGLSHHIVRVPGKGLRRAPGRKGGKPGLTLGVPQWSMPMFRRRKIAAGTGPLFPSAHDTWLDPSNITTRMRQAFDACGYDWLTSHVLRKTVTAHLDEADLPTTAIADQIGDTPAVVERHYRPRRASNAAAVAALETIKKAK